MSNDSPATILITVYALFILWVLWRFWRGRPLSVYRYLAVQTVFNLVLVILVWRGT
jgi:uncharacterized membrane protein